MSNINVSNFASYINFDNIDFETNNENINLNDFKSIDGSSNLVQINSKNQIDNK